MKNCTIVGVAIGDALGMPFEKKLQSDKSILFWDGTYKDCRDHQWSHNLNAGEYTDDTQMTLVLGNYLSNNQFNKFDLAKEYVEWCFGNHPITGKSVGVGGTTKTSLMNFKDAGLFSPVEDSLGTGPIMRCSPFVLKYKNKDTATSLAIEDANITHSNPKVSYCVEKYISYLHDLVFFEGERNLQSRRKIRDLYEVRVGKTLVGGKMQLIETAMLSAFACFDRTDSFAAAVQMAVRLGGDTDTVASITGALAASWYGFGNIPDIYLSGLNNFDLVKDINLKLIG